jgi:hypothetical protein
MLACVDGKKDKGKLGARQRGLKMEQLTLSMGLARVEVRFFVQRATIPSKKVIFFTFINTAHTINIGYTLAIMYI